MNFRDLDLKPTDRKLRQFAVIWLAGFGLVGLLAAWKAGAFGSGVPVGLHAPWTAAVVWWIVAVVGSVLGLSAPAALRPIYVVWMVVAFPIGWTLSLVLLALTYFIVFSGIGLVFKLMRRDPLGRSFDPQAATYWTARGKTRAVADYFRQF
jgi:hypothetical protein